MPRLNRNRFAASVAIIGAVVTPIWTGSLREANRHIWTGERFEDDAVRYQKAHGLRPDACFLAHLGRSYLLYDDKGHYDDDNERKICEDSDSLRGQNVVVVGKYNPAVLAPLVRDLLLGFLLPLGLVFFVPPVVAGYYRWVTKSPEL
ncbi:MAG: hypothetical protein WB760_19010 [Xanthobacteraceae bacterium]